MLVNRVRCLYNINMQKISLIPYACGAGAKNKTCADAPDALRKFGLAESLQAHGLDANWLDNPKIKSNPSAISNVAEHCLALKNQVQDVLQSGGFPITAGGDHSMAVGTWAGVADALHNRRKLGLIWIDAHMDAHTNDTSPTGNLHGMPISYLLGYGGDLLADITGRSPVIVPYQLCLIGVRSFEPEESALLKNLGVRVFMMDEVRARGLNVVLLEAVKIVSAHTSGFGMSIDVDAFDPKVAPGTGTVEAGGILKNEFIEAIGAVLPGYREQLLALEIAEYNPHLDENNITANLIVDIIAAILK